MVPESGALASKYGIAGRGVLLDAVRSTNSLSEAKTLVRDYKDLARLTEQTEQIFQSSGRTYLTPGELARIEESPWTQPMFEGTARDRIFKGLVSSEQMNGRFLSYEMTPQGKRGIDLFTSNRRFGFDLTTAKSWPAHVNKYQNDYGIILPLLYR